MMQPFNRLHYCVNQVSYVVTLNIIWVLTFGLCSLSLANLSLSLCRVSLSYFCFPFYLMPLSTLFSVSPTLGDAVKEMRVVHSGFMTEFHQAIGWFIQQNLQLQEQLTGADNHIATLDTDIAKLQDAMNRLNEVSF
jgi:hypothetical protein